MNIYQETFDGLLITRRIIDSPKVKKEAAKDLKGWKHVTLSAEDWVRKVLDKGYVALIGDMKKCPEDELKDFMTHGYTHRKNLWLGTHIVALDIDEYEYEEDDGKKVAGEPPFDGRIREWRQQNPELVSLLYSLGQSPSSMVKGTPPHRRFRGLIISEMKITCEDDYKNLIMGLASMFPVIPAKKRPPTQPIYGSAAIHYDKRQDKIRPTRNTVRSIIFGNILTEEQVQQFIDAGKQEQEKSILEKQEKQIVKRKSVIRSRNQQSYDDPIPETAINELSKDIEIARSFLEEHGSTFKEQSDAGYEFYRKGGGDGVGEVLLEQDDGTLIFYARSDQSVFVIEGHCEQNEPIPFGVLFCRVKHPGANMLQCIGRIIKEYKHLDNGWRPQRKSYKDMKPWKALNYDMVAAEEYVIEAESEDVLDERDLKVMEASFDERIIIHWNSRWTLFSDYVAYMEDVEDLADQYDNVDFNNVTKKTKETFVILNNLAASIVGNTGDWNNRSKKRGIVE